MPMKCVIVKGLPLSMVFPKHVRLEDIQVNSHHVLPRVSYALRVSFPLLVPQSVVGVCLVKYRVQRCRVVNVQLDSMQSLVTLSVANVL